MFDRIKRSFSLVRASAHILRQDHHLMLFPVLSAFALLLVVLAFALPVFGMHGIDGIGRGGAYSIAFLFYVIQYFVIIYFNVALVGAVMVRLDGGSPTLADGLRVANSRIAAILGYAVISATVGVLLRAIQERVGFVGRLIVGLIGASWAIATFMVVPVIATSDRNALAAIGESGALLKRTWGENMAGQTGIGGAFALIYIGLAAIVCALALLDLPFASAGSPVLFIALLMVIALALLACVLAHATLSGIYAAVLYRYAVDGSDTPGFDNDILVEAFEQKT
jgi:hypothetical protein